MFKDFDTKAFWEAIKLPLRLFVFAVIGFVVDFLIQYFSGLNTQVGTLLSVFLITLDKYIHEARTNDTKKPLEGFDRGLLPF